MEVSHSPLMEVFINTDDVNSNKIWLPLKYVFLYEIYERIMPRWRKLLLLLKHVNCNSSSESRYTSNMGSDDELQRLFMQLVNRVGFKKNEIREGIGLKSFLDITLNENNSFLQKASDLFIQSSIT